MANEAETGTVAGVVKVPTTAAGAERAFALLIVGARVGTVVQMAPSLPQGMSQSSTRWGYLLVWLLAAGTRRRQVVVWRKGRTLTPREYLVDAALCV